MLAPGSNICILIRILDGVWTFSDPRTPLLGNPIRNLETRSIDQHWELMLRVRIAHHCCRRPLMGGLIAYLRIRFRLCITNSVTMTGLGGSFTRDFAARLLVRIPRCDLYTVFVMRVCVAAYDDLCRRTSSMSERDHPILQLYKITIEQGVLVPVFLSLSVLSRLLLQLTHRVYTESPFCVGPMVFNEILSALS